MIMAMPRLTAEAPSESLDSSYSNLESEISDLASMASVNASLMEQAASSTGPEHRPGYSIVRSSDIDDLLFCAFHLRAMAGDLKKQYYAAFETPADK
jgi:hypothetical protein